MMVDKPNNEEIIKEKEEIKEDVSKKEKRKIEALKEEIEKLKADIDHWKNEYYRAYADTKNLRDSLAKDHSNAMKYRIEGVIDNLLPVLDSFHMALKNEPKDPNLKAYLTGFTYIYKNLVNVLEGEGVKEISPKVGDKFDASTMNAVSTVESDGDENLIVDIYAKGYMLHDRIVRPVQVSVSKHKVEEKIEEKADA